jgi:hypothetical protein
MKQILICFFSLIWSQYAVDTAKVKELKDMGFTNEQIIKLLTAPGRDTKARVLIPIPEEFKRKMELMKAKNKGLVVIAFTKESPLRGPGYLDFGIQNNGLFGGANPEMNAFDRFRRGYDLQRGQGEARAGSNSKSKKAQAMWVKLGRANILSYLLDGRRGPTIHEHIDHHHWLFNDYTISNATDLITSRYFGEFEVPAGELEMKVYRRLHTQDDGDWGLIKEVRHKKFHGVKVSPGMITVLSYFWKENSKFGLDHVPSQYHLKFVDEISKKYGGFFKEIRTQHNE